jgi:hypothetical protein
MRVEGFRRLVMSAVRTPPGLDLEIRSGRANGTSIVGFGVRCRGHKCNAEMAESVGATGGRMFSGMFVRNGGEGKDWMGVGFKEGG